MKSRLGVLLRPRAGSLVAAALISTAALAGTWSPTRAPSMVMNGVTGHVNLQVDLNRDGYKDLIVGTGGNDADGLRGRVDVYYGSRNGLSAVAGFSYAGTTAGIQVGRQPQAVDVNGDGWPDLIVGADNYLSSSGQPVGAVMVFFGSPSGFGAVPSQIIQGPSANSHFGFVIRKLGDFNRDGYADIAVSALGADSNLGAIYVYKGSATGLVTTPVSKIAGKAPWTGLGRVFDTGDLDGDGIADIVVGMQSPVGGIPGMAWLYRGTATGYSSTVTKQIFSPVPALDADGFGGTVAVLGDVDGDGYADILVSASNYLRDDQYEQQGAIFIFYGSGNGFGNSVRTQTIFANTVDMPFFGDTVLGQRDVNGDGYPDLIVGTSVRGLDRPLTPTNSPYPGAVYVYTGGPGGFTKAPYIRTGKAGSREMLGYAALEFGDLNGAGQMSMLAGMAINWTATVHTPSAINVYPVGSGLR